MTTGGGAVTMCAGSCARCDAKLLRSPGGPAAQHLASTRLCDWAMPPTQFIAGACAGAAAVYAASKLLAWRRRALSEKPTFYYYPARGRGEQIRLTLAEAGVEFEGKYFDMSDPSSKDPYLADCREKGGNLTCQTP